MSVCLDIYSHIYMIRYDWSSLHYTSHVTLYVSTAVGLDEEGKLPVVLQIIQYKSHIKSTADIFYIRLDLYKVGTF